MTRQTKVHAYLEADSLTEGRRQIGNCTSARTSTYRSYTAGSGRQAGRQAARPTDRRTDGQTYRQAYYLELLALASDLPKSQVSGG